MNWLPFLILFSWAHPFHVSICEIEYNTQVKTLQIAHRIFIDDLERALSEASEEKIYMHRSSSENINKVLERYLQQHFAITIQEKKVEIDYLGYEIENDVVWCYQETSEIGSFNSVQIKNSILQEIFNDQQNIVHVKVEGKVRSLKLNRRKSNDTIVIK